MDEHLRCVTRMRARATRQLTAALCGSLRALDRDGLARTDRMRRNVIIDVLCERHPKADAAFLACSGTSMSEYTKAVAEAASREG